MAGNYNPSSANRMDGIYIKVEHNIATLHGKVIM